MSEELSAGLVIHDEKQVGGGLEAELETDKEGAVERSSEDLPFGEDLSERVG